MHLSLCLIIFRLVRYFSLKIIFLCWLLLFPAAQVLSDLTSEAIPTLFLCHFRIHFIVKLKFISILAHLRLFRFTAEFAFQAFQHWFFWLLSHFYIGCQGHNFFIIGAVCFRLFVTALKTFSHITVRVTDQFFWTPRFVYSGSV